MLSTTVFAAEAPASLVQGVAEALVEGEFDRAEVLARQVLEQAAPGDKAAARNMLGMVLGQAGNYDEAIALFKENAEVDPDDVGAFANWGEALRRAKRPQEALVPLKKAVSLRPDSHYYQLKLRLARIESGEFEAVGKETWLKLQETPPPADWLMTAGAIALHRKNWQEGKILLEQARAVLDPQIYGEFMQDPAFSAYENQAELRGLFPATHRVVPAGPLTLEAMAAYMEDDHDQALELLDQAAAAGEAIGHISNLRGGIFMGKGDFAQAAESFRIAGENSPEEPGVYLNYGEALRGVGNPATAAAVFQEGLRIDPGNETLAVKLLFALVEADAGREIMDNISLQEGKTGPLLVGRAAAAASQGMHDEAARLLTEARSLLPEEAFRGLLQDPVFKAYRETEELSRFWQNR